MHNYTQNVEPNQQERLDSSQVQNNAGGFVYGIDKWARLRRFLVLGSEQNTYYQTARTLTLENAQGVRECIFEDPNQVLTILKEQRTLPKHDTALFVLAQIAKDSPKIIDQESFNVIVRTGTHLFQFLEMATSLRGWGRSLQRLVRGWYTSKDPQNLEYQCAKYRNRAKWTHRDALRCAHLFVPRAPEQIRPLIKYLRAKDAADPDGLPLFQFMSNPPNEKGVIQAIHDLGLTHEMIPSELRTPAVWRALAEKMPIGALVRNLGSLTEKKVIGAGMWNENEILTKSLTDSEAVRKSRIHPISVLLAAKTYASGRGFKGSLSWDPAPDVLHRLDRAFEIAFDNVVPTGKRFLIACDVSGSMSSPIVGTNISAREATAAMSLVTLRTEPKCLVYAFSTQFKPLLLTSKSSLTDCEKALWDHNFGRTDCSLPMVHALHNGVEVDAFVIMTDNETWAGGIHPSRALQEYRRKVNPNAKLVVCGFTSTGFSIADPRDPGSLDVVGFDASAPQVIADFVAGRI